jgi:hypothetical protein
MLSHKPPSKLKEKSNSRRKLDNEYKPMKIKVDYTQVKIDTYNDPDAFEKLKISLDLAAHYFELLLSVKGSEYEPLEHTYLEEACNIENVDPEVFKDLLSEKFPQFNGNKQQDANEFYISVLNSLNESLKVPIINVNNEQIQIEPRDSDLENSKKCWNLYLKYNDSLITDLFCGQLKQTIRCPFCKVIRKKFDGFNILNLPINKSEKKYIYNFQFFYVPKYCIRRAVRICYKKYRNDCTFAECLEKLKNEENFIYRNKINELIINKTTNKK